MSSNKIGLRPSASNIEGDMYEVDVSEGTTEYDSEKKITMFTDFYSLVWMSTKLNQFNGIEVHGVPIFLNHSDFFNIYMAFTLFVISLVLTMFLLIREVLLNYEYKEGTYFMIVLRMILINFGQRLIGVEFKQGYLKLAYTLNHKKMFAYPLFAYFIAASQMIAAIISILSIFLWICMADQYIQPVSGFAAFAVLTCLDDWIGEAIMKSKVVGAVNKKKMGLDQDDEEFPCTCHCKNLKHVTSEVYDLENLNDKLSLFQKMALMDTAEGFDVIVNDEKYKGINLYEEYFAKIVKWKKWNYVLPILVIPASILMPKVHEFLMRYLN